MWEQNFLFEDNETGDLFYVQEESRQRAQKTANQVTNGKATFIRCDDDFIAECNGYDTY